MWNVEGEPWKVQRMGTHLFQFGRNCRVENAPVLHVILLFGTLDLFVTGNALQRKLDVMIGVSTGYQLNEWEGAGGLGDG